MIKIGIYFPVPVFTHGQLFVAFSRGRSFRTIRVQIENGPQQFVDIVSGIARTMKLRVITQFIYVI